MNKLTDYFLGLSLIFIAIFIYPDIPFPTPKERVIIIFIMGIGILFNEFLREEKKNRKVRS